MQASRPNVPTTLERDTVLAAVKDASRRLRRWPAAILDRGCARRHSATAGRDEETALQSNQETDQERLRRLPSHSLTFK